ncbi:oocyte zinc finger protein XlCOF6-like [Plodia interpunctella]|uniref:oocyte zinc finger protein XlCOF6-like n=1 Tax=Plodia interpunctella TaxID=58824 RepID=UPI002368D024|nr:oocyte zinc finger protein XlCOF6-like [Plodia interpunctella]
MSRESSQHSKRLLTETVNILHEQHGQNEKLYSSIFPLDYSEQSKVPGESMSTMSESADTSSHSVNYDKQATTTSETESVRQSEDNDVSRSHCRFCATEMDCKDLLDLSTEDIVEKYIKLLSFLKLEVDFSSHNKLPKLACSTCHNLCIESYRFFLQVKKAQDELNALYSKESNVSGEKEVEPMQIDVIQKMVVGKRVIKTELEDSSDSEPHYTDMDNIPNRQESTPDTKAGSSIKTVFKQPKKEHEDESSSSGTLSKKTTYKVKKTAKSPTKKTVTNVKNVTFSWASYLWSCDHCKAESDTMEDLRLHSRYTHNCCYGFSCVDCNDEFNTFNAFVEHVRTHREYLRLFCQYCNKKFRSKAECVLHALTHWSGGQKICELCGEIFPDYEALKQHKSSYKPKPLAHTTRRKRPRLVDDNLGSWNEYVYTCQDCYQTMPNVHALRAHVREVHMKCFALKCSDCLRVHRSLGELVKHVHAHRPNLKHFCHYCNQYFESTAQLDSHIEEHYSGISKPCYGCGEIFENDELLRKHIFDYGAMRRPGPHSEEDVTCDICSKNCITVGKLKIHRRIHEYKERCYVCDTCGNSYFNFWTYQSHIKIHGERSEICKICKKGFPTKVKLKNHAKTHLVDRPFTCDQCGNAFKTKNKLQRHKMVHTNAKPYVCVICDKSFRQKNGLKNHSAQHTGVRPYQCEFCDRTFTNNPNRDKHMRRRHGVPLYKAKETPQEVLDKTAKEWLSQVTANQKKRKDNSGTQVQ